MTQTSELHSGASPLATLEDALQEAIEFEHSSIHLYMDLAEKVDSQIRPLLLQLAADGEADREFLQGFAETAELNQVPRPNIKFHLLEEASRRSISSPDLGDEPFEDDVLDYIQVREQLAYEYYSRIFDQSRERPLQELIGRLIITKIRHQEQIRSCDAALFLIL